MYVFLCLACTPHTKKHSCHTQTNITQVKGSVIPGIPSYGVGIALVTLGAVIMSHNIYLHSALVQSRDVDQSDHRKVKDANKYNAIESGGALLVSFFINLAVVTTYAQRFSSPECATLDGGRFAEVGIGAIVDGKNLVRVMRQGLVQTLVLPDWSRGHGGTRT